MLRICRPSLLVMALAFAAHTGDALAAKPARAPTAVAALQKSGALLQLPQPDLAALRGEDLKKDGRIGVPLRYGTRVRAGRLDARHQAGTWSQLADGSWSWQLEVAARGATSLEFSFSRFRLPYGASLSIRSVDGQEMLDLLTDADNPSSGELHTAMLIADRALLELHVPAGRRNTLELELDSVVWGYRDPWMASLDKSGSCNVDTICPEGDAWRDQVASVAGYAFPENNDQLWCTGTLMNTGGGAEDLARPRFSTAYHCISTQAEASRMVFYWGYESPTCRVRGSTDNGTARPVRTNTRAVQTGGARLLATDRTSDFTALELNSPVPAAAEAYYSGWDRRGVTPSATVGIHHPNGDEKRITFDDNQPSLGGNCIVSGTPQSTHWYTGPYALGTTETGSSGSGLWSRDNGLLIGVLTGGTAGCGLPDGWDCYGRLSTAWNTAGATGNAFREAFDRSGNRPNTMPGKSSCDAPTVVLEGDAFANPRRAGVRFQIQAKATGGAGDYSYHWDIDDDGVVERIGGDRVTVSFPTQRSMNVRVSVRDGEGCVGTDSRALDILGPEIRVESTGQLEPICGISGIQPGSRFELPVTLKNTGDAPMSAGAFSLFAPASGLEGTGTRNLSGYEDGGQCDYGFIDIASGTYKVDALDTYVANGNTYGPLDDARSTEISLGGPGFTLYGKTWDKAVMSTNGYVSFDPDETGGAWDVTCDGSLTEGARGPQLRVYHDDLHVRNAMGAGLRYRYFDTCPRQSVTGVSQGCHVFQWSGMGSYYEESSSTPYDFQALAYALSGEVVYQYKSVGLYEGDYANAGLTGVNGTDPLNLVCDQLGRPIRPKTAMCILSPQIHDFVKPSLRVLKPASPLPTLAAGAKTTIRVPVAVDADAACSAPLNLRYIATANGKVHSARESTHLVGAVDAVCQPTNSCPANVGDIAVRDGNYYNASRPGNGFNSYDYGGVWYTANSDHSPTWYGVTGDYVDNLLSAPLLRATDRAERPELEVLPPPGSINPPYLDIEKTPVGQLQLARVSTDKLMMAWSFTDGRAGAELLTPATAELPRAPLGHTGHWYPPAESGWGLDVESFLLNQRSQDGVLMYFYDRQGMPRWLLSDGQPVGGRLAMKAYQPHCPACVHYDDWNANRQDAGDIRLQWNGQNKGTISTDISLPPPLQGAWLRHDVPLVPIRENTHE